MSDFVADLAEALELELNRTSLERVEVRVLDERELSVETQGEYEVNRWSDGHTVAWRSALVRPGKVHVDSSLVSVGKPKNVIEAAAVLLRGDARLIGTVNGSPVYDLGEGNSGAGIFSPRGVFLRWGRPRREGISGSFCFGSVAESVAGDVAPLKIRRPHLATTAFAVGDSGAVIATAGGARAGLGIMIVTGSMTGGRLPYRSRILPPEVGAAASAVEGDLLKVETEGAKIDVLIGRSGTSAFSVAAGEMSVIGSWRHAAENAVIISPPAGEGVAPLPAVPVWDELLEVLHVEDPMILVSLVGLISPLEEDSFLVSGGGRLYGRSDAWTARSVKRLMFAAVVCPTDAAIPEAGVSVSDAGPLRASWDVLRPTFPATLDYVLASEGERGPVAWLAGFGDVVIGASWGAWTPFGRAAELAIGDDWGDVIATLWRDSFGADALFEAISAAVV